MAVLLAEVINISQMVADVLVIIMGFFFMCKSYF